MINWAELKESTVLIRYVKFSISLWAPAGQDLWSILPQQPNKEQRETETVKASEMLTMN